MHKRDAEMIRRLCRQLGTYDSDRVHEALHDRTGGDPPCTMRELAALLPQFSREIDTVWKPIGGGQVLRLRKLTVFEYAGD